MSLVSIFKRKADDNTRLSQLTVPTFTSNIWRSEWFQVKDDRRINIELIMNQPTATDGITFEQTSRASPSSGSAGDTHARYWSTFNDAASLSTNPVTGATGYILGASVETLGLWARVCIKHAGTAPTTFELTATGAGVT